VQREGLRDERKRERERDYRIAMAAPEKRSKLMRGAPSAAAS
jgi:hypothetical protein